MSCPSVRQEMSQRFVVLGSSFPSRNPAQEVLRPTKRSIAMPSALQRTVRAGPPDGLIQWPRLNPSVASGDQAPRKAVSHEVTDPTLTMPFVPAKHGRRPPRRE